MRVIEHDGVHDDPGGGGRLWVRRVRSPLGPMAAGVMECTRGEGLALLEFAEGPRSRRGIDAVLGATGADEREGAHPLHAVIEARIGAYGAGELRAFDVCVHLIGTPFQRRVWRALLDIPPGQTRSYQDLAVGLGVAGGSRAVGRANGANRMAIVVPCHRVIASDGTLGGYGGGLERKRRLLDLEGAGVLSDRHGSGAQAPSLWGAGSV